MVRMGTLNSSMWVRFPLRTPKIPQETPMKNILSEQAIATIYLEVVKEKSTYFSICIVNNEVVLRRTVGKDIIWCWRNNVWEIK